MIEDGYDYKVSAGEIVTVEITPIGVGPLVAGALNDGPIAPEVAGDHVTFSFTAVEAKNYLSLGYSFPPDTPGTAKYKVKIRGSEGGDFDPGDVEGSGQTTAGSERVVRYVFNV